MGSGKPKPIRIPVEKAKEMVDRGEGQILDVVDTPSYESLEVRIQGAKRIPPEEFRDRYEDLPEDKIHLAY